MSRLIVCLSFMFLFIAHAQVVEEPIGKAQKGKKELSQMTKEKIMEQLEELENTNYEEVERQLNDLNKKVLFYVQQRNKECKGEFSSIEINEDGESEVVKRKLSKDEKKLCLLELVTFRKNYLNDVFELRKKVLINYHNEQLEELENIRRQSIQKMDELAQKLAQ